MVSDSVINTGHSSDLNGRLRVPLENFMLNYVSCNSKKTELRLG